MKVGSTGHYLRLLRTRAGMSAKEVGRRIGYTEQYVIKAENKLIEVSFIAVAKMLWLYRATKDEVADALFADVQAAGDEVGGERPEVANIALAAKED